MSTQQYEHHLALRRDKLCPFKFKSSNNLHNAVCNWHRNIEILLVTDGEGRMQYGSEDFAIEKHDIVVVNSGDLHRPYSESGISFKYMIIDESFCVENGIETANRAFEHHFKSERVEELCLEAYRCSEAYKLETSDLNAAKLRLAVLVLLVELCDKHTLQSSKQETVQKSSEEYVKKALEYLAEHYTEQVALEDVARVCGVTKYHLAREFKRYTGQTVFTYINTLRCKKAEICISQGMTVTEASGESGFESISYFSRTYKRLMGHSPSSEKSKN